MQAAFCCPARSASRVVAKAALRARWMSIDTGNGEGELRAGKPLKRGSRRWQAREKKINGTEEELQHQENKEEDTAAAGKLGQYEMLLQGARSGPRGETPRVSRQEARSRNAASGAPQNAVVSREEALVANGKNSAHGWTEHMMWLSQKLRDREARKTLTKEQFDYVGLPIEPEPSTLESPLPIPWAVDAKERQDLSASQLLDEEIRRFVQFMQSHYLEKNARVYVNDLTRSQIIPLLGKGAAVVTFGSSATRTDLPFSDIDLGIVNNDRRPVSYSRMEEIYQTLDNGNEFICVVFRGGKYPIITAQHAKTGLDIQIVGSLEDGKIRKTEAILHSEPHLRSLYSVVRTMLGIRGFVNPFIGGISAYGAMLMIAASMKLPKDPAYVSGADSAAAQLLEYLDFFAKFDSTRNALSVEPPVMVTKRAEGADRTAQPTTAAEHTDQSHAPLYRAVNSPTSNAKMPLHKFRDDELQIMANLNSDQPYLLCLQDPAKATNDLGGRCHAIKHILRTIQHLNSTLRSSMHHYDEARARGSPVEGEYSLLLPLVGRCHEVYAERRARLRAFALDGHRAYNRGRRTAKSKNAASMRGAQSEEADVVPSEDIVGQSG